MRASKLTAQFTGWRQLLLVYFRARPAKNRRCAREREIGEMKSERHCKANRARCQAFTANSRGKNSLHGGIRNNKFPQLAQNPVFIGTRFDGRSHQFSRASAGESLFMSSLSFHKMHGAGNDFVVLDGFGAPFSPQLDIAGLAQLLCPRHFGVGADGLLALEPSEGADARMRMWNPDGTPDMCGNGLRCVAATRAPFGITLAKRAFLRSKRSPESAKSTVLRRGPHCAPQMGRAAMGRAPSCRFDRRLQPAHQRCAMAPSTIGDEVIFHNVTALSTGSTHTVIFRDAPLAAKAEFERLSPLIRKSPAVSGAHFGDVGRGPMAPNKFPNSHLGARRGRNFGVRNRRLRRRRRPRIVTGRARKSPVQIRKSRRRTRSRVGRKRGRDRFNGPRDLCFRGRNRNG